MKIQHNQIHRIAGIGGLLLMALFFIACQSGFKYKTLVVIPDTEAQARAEILGTILEKTNQFKVQFSEAATPDAFRPAFHKFDLVVLTGNGKAWPDEVQEDFVQYVGDGGGIIFHHVSETAFSGWETFTTLTGLKDWGRSETPGSEYIFKEDPGMDLPESYAGASLTDAHPYVVTHLVEHPIIQGLPDRWMHEKDMLLNYLHGPGSGTELIAAAYSDTAYNGSGHYEPVLLTGTYGMGRIFHTTMAQDLASLPDAFHCAGFITTLQRGAEWVVSGAVGQSVPLDFPNSASTMTWPDYEPLTLDALFALASNYEYGTSRKYLSDISGRIRQASETSEDLGIYERKMIDFLNSDATAESKNHIIQELSWMGTDACIPTLKELANREDTGEMARFALERLAFQPGTD
jgi:hypothetical protein